MIKNRKEGAAEKAVSKVKEVAEDAKDAVEGAIEGVKNMIKRTINSSKIDWFFHLKHGNCSTRNLRLFLLLTTHF